MKIVILLLLLLFPITTPMVSELLGFSYISGLYVGIGLDLFLVLFGVRIVKQKTVKLVEFLGKFNRILRPGFNVIIPILETTIHQELYKKNFDVKVQGVTKDNVTVYISLNVVHFVKEDENSIQKSIYEIDDPLKYISSTVDEQCRAMMTQFSHKEIFSKRQEIGDEIEQSLRERLSSFGYTIDSIQVTDIMLDSRVMSTMNEVIASEKEKEATANKAEAELILKTKDAEAEKITKRLLGEGMAEQREAIADGFKGAVEKIRSVDSSISASDVLEFLLDSSRIETLNNIGLNNAKLIYLNENLEASNNKILAGLQGGVEGLELNKPVSKKKEVKTSETK